MMNEELIKANDDEDDVDPFKEYKHWGDKDVRKPGQDESETPASSSSSTLLPKRTNKGKPFSPEEVAKLRDLSAKQAANIITARNHYADPRKNPRMHREAQLHLAHDTAFKPMHDAWSELSDSDTYKSASLPKKWRMQKEFINNWHDSNPEHYPAAMDAIKGAHGKGEQADLAHTQDEKRKLEHASMGGGLGSMSSKEAAAHFGVKGADDETPQANTSQSAAVKFAGANPEAVKQALANKRFENIPEEDIEVAGSQGRAPIKKHPDFDKPENKKLIEDFASRYAHLQNSDFVNKIKNEVGASGADIDDASLSDAAHNAMWMGMHNYNAGRSGMSMDQYIKRHMVDAIKNNVKQQHTEQTSAAAKRATKQLPPKEDARLAAPVKVFSPEERAALQAKMQGQAVPKPTSAIPEAPAPQVQKPHFSEHLDDSAKERMKSIDAAKMAVKPKE